MGKELEEIRAFNTGLISSPSTVDIPKEAATYSLNIDPNVEQGALSGIADNKILGNNSWENPRYLVYRMKLLTHGGGFNVNNYQRQWFHFDTYNQRYWVWLAQDDSTTNWVDGSSGRESEYNLFIDREYQEEVRIALTGSTSTTDVATKIAAALTALGPPSNSFLYNEVATTWFTSEVEIISNIPHVKFTSNYYGSLGRIGITDANNSITSDYFDFPDVDGDIVGSGKTPLDDLGNFNFSFIKTVDKGDKHSFLGISNQSLFYSNDIYSDNSSLDQLSLNTLPNDGFGKIASNERNKNVYLGLGSRANTRTKWLGEIDRHQLSNEYKGTFIEDAECKRPLNRFEGIKFDHIVIPLLHSGMNSTNSMIAGAASLYGAGASTGDGNACGGADKFVNDSDPGTHRTLNGWVMQCLINAGAAFQSDGISAADDADNFHWSSLKRGMILRVNIGTEGSSAKYVARNDWNSIGTPASGDAITELKRIKEIGFADTSEIDTQADEGVELHDGDLFQVVTVPSGAAAGHDTTGNSNGDNANYPRLIYVGALIGNNSDHDSTNAHHAAPAWAYGCHNDSSILHRIALSECNDADITSTNTSNTFSTSGATGGTTSNSEFLSRTTTFDLANIISSEFKIGTISNCVSTDGNGGINGRVGTLKKGYITGVAVSGANVTFTVQDAASSGTNLTHGYMIGDWVTISDLHADHNGTYQITAVPANHQFTCVTGGTNTGDTAGRVVGLTRNYYAGHGKLWVTSSNVSHSSKIWLVDVVNWHGDDADNTKVTAIEFKLDFTRIHDSLISSISGKGLIEEPYWSKIKPGDAEKTEVDWVDREWSRNPQEAFIGGVCETYSHQPHLDDGANTGAGLGRWRVWMSYCKINVDDTFNRWDLFLFNIRPTEFCEDGTSTTAFMYDKTPPYQECGSMKIYYNNTENRVACKSEPIFFPKDKFMFSRGPLTCDKFSNSFVNSANWANYEDVYTQVYSDFSANLTIQDSSDGSNIDLLAGCHVADTGDGINADNYNARALGVHCFVKGNEATEKKFEGTNANAGNQCLIFRDSTEFYRESRTTVSLGGPMFKDPSGMWHMLELGSHASTGADALEDAYSSWGSSTPGQLSRINLGHNLGWLNSSFDDTQQFPRATKVLRHSLIPMHLKWFDTGGSDSTQEYLDTIEGTASKVAHQINLFTRISGKFVKFGGIIGGGMENWRSDSTVTESAWAVRKGGRTNEYEETHMLFQVHDSPCAFTTTAVADDNTMDNTVTSWGGGHEIQGRPGIIDSDSAVQDDIIANWNVNKAVAPSQGFSAYNQFRWGQSKNGTADIDAGYNGQSEYSTNSLWNTWDSYRGNDGYGHYTNITTTWSSVCDASYPALYLDIPAYNWDRYRNFNTAYSLKAGGDAVVGSPSGTKSNDQDMTNGGVDGSGYFTWHANNYEQEGTEDYVTRVRGFYPKVANWKIADGSHTDLFSDSNDAPDGTKWDNRRIVMCWSTLEGDTGWKKNSTAFSDDGDTGTNLAKNPRCVMKKVDKSFTSYDGDEEKGPYNSIHNVDQIPVYNTTNFGDGAINELESCFLVNGHVPNGDIQLNMTAVYSSFRGSNISTHWGEKVFPDISDKYYPSIKRSLGAIRPVQKVSSGTTYNSKRCYYNEYIYTKNLTPTSFLAGTAWDLYCPIIVSSTKENDKTYLGIWRRSSWLTANDNAQAKEIDDGYSADEGYKFDRFYNLAGSDAETTPYGLDNSSDATVSTRFPSEFIGSTAGTGTGDADTASGSDSTAAGVHMKESKVNLFSLSTLATDPGESGEFKENDTIEYKISYVYDGFQDSPLSSQSWPYRGTSSTVTDGLDQAYKGIDLSISIPSAEELGLSKRVTHIYLWRRNNFYENFRYIDQIDLSKLHKEGQDENGNYNVRITDKKSFETYENLTGISSVLDNTSLNYSIATQLNDFLYVSGVYHKDIEDSSNFIFRSKPGKFSVFDWSNDFISMPSKPIALAAFAGKLYVFSREKLYRLDPDQMFIESVLDGIGILNQESIVVTDYGMFFCDANNMYHHDGSAPKPIGDTVLENQSNSEWSIGYKKAVQKAIQKGYVPIVKFDAKNKCVYFMIQGYNEGVSSYSNDKSRVYAYSFRSGRFDYLEMPPVKSACVGKDGELILSDGYQLWGCRQSSHKRKAWSWDSKLFDMGTLVSNKVFKSLKLTGSPTIADLSGGSDDDVLVYIDGVQQKMTIDKRSHSITRPIAGFTADQNWDGNSGADSGAIYALISALPGKDEITYGGTNPNSFVLKPDSMPEFASGVLTNQDRPVQEGEIENLKYISPGQYLMMEMTNSSNNRKIKEIVKVSSVNFIWASDNSISRIEIECERGQLGTSAYDFQSTLATDQNWEHASIRYVGVSLKFPTAAKGRSMQIKLRNQKGTIDSISFVYRQKNVK